MRLIGIKEYLFLNTLNDLILKFVYTIKRNDGYEDKRIKKRFENK